MDSNQDLQNKLEELKVVFEGNTRERMMDSLWKYCRKNIAGPAFLVNHPELVSPLSKEIPGIPHQTQRFQVILAGSEVGNGYSELNDPIKQAERFDIQEGLLSSGDTEAMMKDAEFLEMLEHGIPPTCGFGFGERLFSFMVDKPIREVQTFPLMKPRE
jgi:lysyl-tRNA synthetase class 2